ncbi:MAG: RNHCP domain protein [Spirochaetaceae bacterium]|nr:RNHCP domain protein [Spirochaetaceae bacterium]
MKYYDYPGDFEEDSNQSGGFHRSRKSGKRKKDTGYRSLDSTEYSEFRDSDADSKFRGQKQTEKGKVSLSERRKPSREFRCRNCKHVIGIPESGTRQRNHCPLCLHSLHLDVTPGDRASDCKSLMDPIAIWVRSGEWVLLHRCRGCGEIRPNRVAPDDNETLLISLAMKPIGQPAFPLYSVSDES